MGDKKLCLHGALLRRERGLEIAMDRDRGRDIGAVAGELEHIAAAEAEADRRAAAVGEIALRGFGIHGVIGGADARALFDRIFAQRIGERRGAGKIGRPGACAVHVGDENNIAVAGDEFGAFDR